MTTPRWQPTDLWAKTVAYTTLEAAGYGCDAAADLAVLAVQAWKRDQPADEPMWASLDKGVAIGVAAIVAARLQALADDASTRLADRGLSQEPLAAPALSGARSARRVMAPSRPHPAKAEIVSRGFKIKDVASAVGVNAHTFGRVLNGHLAPWPALTERLAVFLDVPADQLWHNVAEPAPGKVPA